MAMHIKWACLVGVLASTAACAAGAEDTEDGEPDVEQVGTVASELGSPALPNNLPFANALGFSATYSVAGRVTLTGPFFQAFGTNDRTCASCHKVGEGWSISTAGIRLLFAATGGRDPMFRTNDGSNNPNADVSTLAARKKAYSMLLDRGTIRVGLPVPAGADFELVAVDDPYGFASAAELSLFRRPLPATNLAAIKNVMWDGRVTGPTIRDALAEQANGATQGHAAAPLPLSNETRRQIVDFEFGLFNAQTISFKVGSLEAGGGADALASQDIGPPAGSSVEARRWDLFDAWKNSGNAKRRQIWRGQELFNTRTHVVGNPNFTCTNCHTVKHIGTDIQGRFFNVLNPTTKPLRRAADQPLYTFRYTGPTEGNLVNGTVLQTTDPGRALITGRFADMQRFKVPSMRGLAARAPYFHDGSAATLEQVVRDYETQQDFVFTAEERADLVAFLSAL